MPIIGQISVGDGATFTPSVSSAGELSWTNNKNLPNPATVDIAQAVIDSGAGIFLPLTGGTVTGSVEVTGGITANVTGNADTATNATNDSNGNQIDTTYLPLSGGTLTGNVNGVTPADSDDSTKLATTEFVDNVFLGKIISKLQEVSNLPAGTSFPSTTVLSKMIANMMSEDGVQYNYSISGSDSAWYVKLGAKYGGLIIQGGRKYIPSTQNWTEIVLPITFSVEAMSCAAVMGATNGLINMYFSGKGKVSYKALNASWASEPLCYIAIGF